MIVAQSSTFNAISPCCYLVTVVPIAPGSHTKTMNHGQEGVLAPSPATLRFRVKGVPIESTRKTRDLRMIDRNEYNSVSLLDSYEHDS